MSHIKVRQLISSKYELADIDWYYQFSSAIFSVDDEKLKKYIARKQDGFSKITKNWNDKLNTEWTVRIYFSAKMILAASLTLESLEYARSVNLKTTVPYLQYYSIFYSLRSLLFVLKDHEWNKGKLIQNSHASTIDIVCDEIAKIDTSWVINSDNMASIKDSIYTLKNYREIISYRAPSSGSDIIETNVNVLPICKAAVELAQLISEIFEKSLHKHCSKDYKPSLLAHDLKNTYIMKFGNSEYIDKEDKYRIGYLARKHPFPANILHIISEGHVEDFFGSWCDLNADEVTFNPDDNWRILFDLP